MTDLPRLKANEKLPRGTYFYIQVGHRFYAGEEAESIEVEDKPSTIRTPYYKRVGNRFGPVRDNFYSWGGRGRTQTKSRVRKDEKLKQAAKYISPAKRPDPVLKKEFTGVLHSRLVDEAAEAKKYRRKDLVESACERLKALYADSGAQVSIRYEGGKNEHP